MIDQESTLINILTLSIALAYLTRILSVHSRYQQLCEQLAEETRRVNQVADEALSESLQRQISPHPSEAPQSQRISYTRLNLLRIGKQNLASELTRLRQDFNAFLIALEESVPDLSEYASMALSNP